MEQSAGIFEVTVGGLPLPLDNRLVIKPEDTTDGVPVYHCASADGAWACELRREATGEWVQISGDLPQEAVEKIGESIAKHTG